MDTELFQWVVVGLLAVSAVVLLALLAALSGIRKALGRAGSSGPSVGLGKTGGGAGWTAAAGDSGEPAEDTPSSTAETSPRSETADVSATAPAGAEGRAGSIRSALEQHGFGEQTPAHQQPDPSAAHPAAAQPVEEPGAASAFAAHADDPQDEPFQRDGRWWFRRGDELLLYDERSGQWQPAPEAGPARSGSDPGGGVQTTPVADAPPVADEVATFWKCPTCGAVNGSTAATCRMCFAARP